jgi:hypothetical protein
MLVGGFQLFRVTTRSHGRGLSYVPRATRRSYMGACPCQSSPSQAARWPIKVLAASLSMGRTRRALTILVACAGIQRPAIELTGIQKRGGSWSLHRWTFASRSIGFVIRTRYSNQQPSRWHFPSVACAVRTVPGNGVGRTSALKPLPPEHAVSRTMRAVAHKRHLMLWRVSGNPKCLARDSRYGRAFSYVPRGPPAPG